jgi:uncharacterized membrane protein YozB (DUF420 family)
MTIKMLIATIAWGLLVVGFLKRRERKTHVRFMMSGIFLDLGVVIYLQITRNAVQTAAKLDLGLFPTLHIGASLIAVVLFIPTVFIGIKMLAGGDVAKLKPWHVRFAIPALFFRTLGFFFMFSMIK